MSDDLKRQAAAAALAEIRPGMRLGLGTGSTARHFVDLLGDRVKSGLDVLCVPTSEATAAQARGLAIPLTTLDETPELDLTIDGADEIGPGLALIKGAGGGAVARKDRGGGEPADGRDRRPQQAGRRWAAFPLPIEVNRFGLGATRLAVERIAARHKAEGGVKLRLAAAGRTAA